MTAFAARCLRVFFRDKAAVFFSLLASFIIIGLYVLFLGDVWSSNFDMLPNSREIMDNWIMAGLLSVTSFTTTMGAFGTMVNDRTQKIDKDFYSSPISRGSIAGGYILSSYIIGLILSLVTLIFAEIYIVLEGGSLMSFSTFIKVFLLLAGATLSNTTIVFFMTSFFTSQNAFATASTVIGTLIGFVTGTYLPIGSLPEAVQWIIKLFPPSHASALLRQVMMEAPMAETFSLMPEEFLSGFKESMGLVFKFGGAELSFLGGIIVIMATAALFFCLSVMSISRKRK